MNSLYANNLFEIKIKHENNQSIYSVAHMNSEDNT